MKPWGFSVQYGDASSQTLLPEAIITNQKSQSQVENIPGRLCKPQAKQLGSEEKVKTVLPHT